MPNKTHIYRNSFSSDTIHGKSGSERPLKCGQDVRRSVIESDDAKQLDAEGKLQNICQPCKKSLYRS